MRRQLPVITFLVAMAVPGLARAEWFYLGVHLGGQYLDLDALSGGDIFNQALDEATTDFTVSTPEPRSYSAENGFVYGGYFGVNLRIFRIGARITHSFMEVVGEGVGEADMRFGLNLLTALIEAQVAIPISIVRPFFGIGLGYAFLDSEVEIVHGGQDGQSDLGTSCLDAMAAVGIDINLGRWFSLGVAAHFSFIGFYYDDPESPEKSNAAWGFATDYVARATLRI